MCTKTYRESKLNEDGAKKLFAIFDLQVRRKAKVVCESAGCKFSSCVFSHMFHNTTQLIANIVHLTANARGGS